MSIRTTVIHGRISHLPPCRNIYDTRDGRNHQEHPPAAYEVGKEGQDGIADTVAETVAHHDEGHPRRLV